MKYIKLYEELGNLISGYKIDSRNRIITMVELEKGDYDEIYSILGYGCRSYECPIYFDNGDAIFTDEEFLIRDMGVQVDNKGMFEPQAHGFYVEGFENIKIIGNGFMLGSDNEGESTDPGMTLESLKNRVVFIEKINGKWFRYKK
jgi:hypothetical protein